MTSSTTTEYGKVGQWIYSGTKGFISSMTLPMARDLGKYGIRVVTIEPGDCDTPLARAAALEYGDNYMKEVLKQTPVGRLCTIEEFGDLVKTIVENTYLNGVRMKLHGGLIGKL